MHKTLAQHLHTTDAQGAHAVPHAVPLCAPSLPSHFASTCRHAVTPQLQPREQQWVTFPGQQQRQQQHADSAPQPGGGGGGSGAGLLTGQATHVTRQLRDHDPSQDRKQLLIVKPGIPFLVGLGLICYLLRLSLLRQALPASSEFNLPRAFPVSRYSPPFACTPSLALTSDTQTRRQTSKT